MSRCNIYRKREPSFRAAINRAQDEYHDYLEREIIRTLEQIGAHYPGKIVEYVGGMGTYYFKMGDNREYLGYGAKAMLQRLDSALDDYGWPVIPANVLQMLDGKLLDPYGK